MIDHGERAQLHTDTTDHTTRITPPKTANPSNSGGSIGHFRPTHSEPPSLDPAAGTTSTRRQLSSGSRGTPSHALRKSMNPGLTLIAGRVSSVVKWKR
ncbi:hypothetical protein CVT26_008973 [Gymnopilus dilepis]|uniref:Uncharacterized protein n=1 Tax=Gymnopilus dilepis TaxID=231916 RepID=A0A409X4C6_9AGAR|nr:hypothetical protein CVT26_008973 [Gymnopilus dilepis]